MTKEPTTEERLRADPDTMTFDDAMLAVEMNYIANLASAIAHGSNADIAECLRQVKPQFLYASILHALADRLENPRGNKTRAAASRNWSIADQFEWFYRKRLAAGERKHGLTKKLISEISERRGVSRKTVENAISKKSKHRRRSPQNHRGHFAVDFFSTTKHAVPILLPCAIAQRGCNGQRHALNRLRPAGTAERHVPAPRCSA